MKYLITQTLIGAWNYIYSCDYDYRENAMQSFMETLSRVKHEPTKEMQNGIDFENEVYKATAGVPRSVHPNWEHGINSAADIIHGATTQVKAKRDICIDGVDFLVYGILDALKAGTIYDIKFNNKGFHSAYLAGKYIDSPQHPTYLFLVPEAFEFKYIVSDGKDIYVEIYNRRNSRTFEEIAKEFINGLKSLNLWDVYIEKWAAL